MGNVGLIINERSNRTRSVIDDLLTVAKRHDAFQTEVLDGVNGLENALTTMNDNHVDTVILAGGDGTMQAAFTDAINNHRFEHTPHYVALPCGMTNVIANDCGLPGAPAESLDQFMHRRSNGELKSVQRALLSVSMPSGDPVYGFFLGAGAFHSAVKFSRENIQTKGAKRSLALVASIASYIYKVATDPNNSFEPVDLEFLNGAPEGEALNATRSLFLATTLNKLGSGIFPFWDETPDQSNSDIGMAATMAEFPMQRLLRAAPLILRSKYKPWLQEFGYRSWRQDKIALRFEGPFVFDGEIFHATREHETIMDATVRINFLT